MKNITKFAVSFVAVAALFVAADASAYTHMGTLKMGSTGSQVMELQKALNGNGFSVSVSGAGSSGMESTYFGAKTKSAVMNFQAAKGLTADGIVGPASGAALSGLTGTGSGGTSTVPGCSTGAMFSSTTGAPCTGGSTTPTGPLAGTDGSIDNVTELGSYNNEEVGEDQSDVKIVGFEVETSNDGDIAVRSAKVNFTITNASGSDNLDDYIDGVSVWMGSTKVGSSDVDSFSEGASGVWTRTVQLSNAVVKSDDSVNFYIAVDAANSFDSGDIDSEIFTADVDSLRYEDGSGVVSTYNESPLAVMNVPVAFVSFSTAADTELRVSTASDSPESGTVIVDDTSSTDNVSLLKGKIKIEGDSDVLIDELPITFTATSAGTANGIDDIATSVTLKIGGEEFTETMNITSALTGTITFDNLDLTIDAGDTENFEILADITDLDGTVFAAGDTLTASLTATNSDYIDAENEQGDQLTDDTEKTGTATGDAQEFRVTGISVSLVSTDESVAADGTNTYNDTGTFVIKYKVTAVGDTIYVADGVTATTATSISALTVGADANLYLLDIGGTATVSAVTDLITYTTDNGAEDSTNGFQLEEGESAVVTMTVARTNTSVYASGGLMRVFLKSIGWNTNDSSTFNVYDFNLDDFKTDPISVN